ncbi:PilZ domain-containing protein [Acidithiobacillus sp. AMEEHan]|uniref:PilZ domain-containing protein n=1 Tax=Acidithiobacillus sp. AMEEHan TaxID=2994951 RepID=UPI0027E3D336|nr:PilZ domain-containing protein [Acidithiobacillus sp. AMEEHan]
MSTLDSNARALSVVLRDAESVQRYFLPQVRGGGILVETQNLLPMGTDVLLMITLPDNGQRTPLQGKVIWVMPKENREGHPPAIGIRFTNDRSGILTRIQSIIGSLPKGQKREILAF